MGFWHRVQGITLGLAVAGCASAGGTDAALGAGARALVAVDAPFARAYEAARIEARENSATWEERDAKLKHWEAARSALSQLRTALHAAEAAEEGRTPDALACVADALSKLREALRNAGHDPPALASSAESAMRALGGRCQ